MKSAKIIQFPARPKTPGARKKSRVLHFPDVRGINAVVRNAPNLFPLKAA